MYNGKFITIATHDWYKCIPWVASGREAQILDMWPTRPKNTQNPKHNNRKQVLQLKQLY